MNRENKAAGVTYIERFTRKSVDVDAKYVVLAASTLENTRLLLLSAREASQIQAARLVST
jgi:hypothetical protein